MFVSREEERKNESKEKRNKEEGEERGRRGNRSGNKQDDVLPRRYVVRNVANDSRAVSTRSTHNNTYTGSEERKFRLARKTNEREMRQHT